MSYLELANVSTAVDRLFRFCTSNNVHPRFLHNGYEVRIVTGPHHIPNVSSFRSSSIPGTGFQVEKCQNAGTIDHSKSPEDGLRMEIKFVRTLFFYGLKVFMRQGREGHFPEIQDHFGTDESSDFTSQGFQYELSLKQGKWA